MYACSKYYVKFIEDRDKKTIQSNTCFVLLSKREKVL